MNLPTSPLLSLPRLTVAAAIVATTAIVLTMTFKSEAPALPKLVDLGASKCHACIAMAPVLDELKQTYRGVLDVEFLDVTLKQHKEAIEAYKIETIPTQIFLAPDGTELWRHVGAISKADILAKWKSLGYVLENQRRE